MTMMMQMETLTVTMLIVILIPPVKPSLKSRTARTASTTMEMV